MSVQLRHRRDGGAGVVAPVALIDRDGGGEPLLSHRLGRGRLDRGIVARRSERLST